MFLVADHTLRIDADAHFVRLRDDDTLFVYVHVFPNFLWFQTQRPWVDITGLGLSSGAFVRRYVAGAYVRWSFCPPGLRPMSWIRLNMSHSCKFVKGAKWHMRRQNVVRSLRWAQCIEEMNQSHSDESLVGPYNFSMIQFVRSYPWCILYLRNLQQVNNQKLTSLIFKKVDYTRLSLFSYYQKQEE